MQIGFVSHQHHGNATNGTKIDPSTTLLFITFTRTNILSLSHHVQQLLVDDLDDFERLLAGDRVHQHVPVEVHAVLGGKYAVLILTGGVDQFHLVVG